MRVTVRRDKGYKEEVARFKNLLLKIVISTLSERVDFLVRLMKKMQNACRST
jgi:hypothetical protein